MSSKLNVIDSPDFSNNKAEKDEKKLEKEVSQEEVEEAKVLQECANSVKTHGAQEVYQDFISNLSPEVALKILIWLDPIDLVKLSQTCRKMRPISEDEYLWKYKCREAGLKDILNSRDKEILEDRNKENSFKFSSSKANFVKHIWREMNFIRNPSKQPTVFEDSDVFITNFELFNNIVCGYDNTIKVWCAFSGDRLLTLARHADAVLTIQINQEFIISGSQDTTLKVWSATTGACLRTLRGHTGPVWCSHLSGDDLVSGSWDKTVRLWNMREGTCLSILEGHQNTVRCVQFNGRMVASGGSDAYIKIWDTDTAKCLHTLRGHSYTIGKIKFYGDHLVSGSQDQSVRVWDIKTGEYLHTIPVSWSLGLGESMALQDNILITANRDNNAQVWNILTGSCLHTLGGPHKHSERITSIQYDRKFVVTASHDRTIKLWDVETGEFVRNLLELEEGKGVRVMKMKGAKIVVFIEKRSAEVEIVVLNFEYLSTKFFRLFSDCNSGN